MRKASADLQYTWWKYLLVILLSITVWVAVFDILGTPEKNQKLQITFVGEDFLFDALQADLQEKMPGLTDQELKKLTVESPMNGNWEDYHDIMSVRAYSADIIIVEESAMTDTFGYSYFVELPVEKLPQSLQNRDFYTEDGKAYGILLYDGSTPNVFSQYYSGGERCYLFITHNCVNAAGIMGKGKQTDDAALAVIEYLLEAN